MHSNVTVKLKENNMTKFVVGDVCIIVKCYSFPEVEGTEVTITELPKLRVFVERPTYKISHEVTYKTDLKLPNGGGGYFAPLEHQLKLKKFKGEEEVMRMFLVPINVKTNEEELA